MAQRDDAIALQPDAHADHVFRIGARIEVDPAQNHQQGLSHCQGSWPGVLLQKALTDHGINAAALLEPFLCRRAGTVEVHP